MAIVEEFETTSVNEKYFDSCNGLSETSDSYEDLTDESNVCEDDLTLPIVALSALSFPTEEDEFELEESCRSPGLELKLYEIESFPTHKTDADLTVVFDLDETLVHARDGIIKPRPYITELLKSLQGRCELLVWTAGVKGYAERVVTAIDTDQVIKQCICRADSWFPTADPLSHAKDLRLLGRDLSRTIIIENTPDCIVKNPLNSILVPDYNREDPSDTVLQTVALVLDGLLLSPLSVPEYLAASPLLRLELLRNQSGATLPVFMVR